MAEEQHVCLDQIWLARRFFDITKVGVAWRASVAQQQEQRLQESLQREGRDRSSIHNVHSPDMDFYAVAVLSVNFATGLEITLKALRSTHTGKKKRGHSLIAIYDELPGNIKDVLKEAFAERKRTVKFPSFPHFRSLLETCDSIGIADGRTKYLYETMRESEEGFSLLTARTLDALSDLMIEVTQNRTLFPPDGLRLWE